MMRTKNLDLINSLVLSLVWIGMLILVNPIGDFPLNDDWAYAWSVKILLETGDFQLADWTATNLLSQVYWGAIFCLPFGFSFTALRFSTITLGLAGVLVTYKILREINVSPRLSFLGALLIAVNPIYFELSNTFMNDVPFFSFAVIAFYFLLRGLKYDSVSDILIGTICSCLAILSRQLGLVLPLAFGCAYLVRSKISIKTLIKGISPFLVGILTQISYQKWLSFTDRTPIFYGNQINTLKQEVAEGGLQLLLNFAKITSFSLLYLGLFLFPFLILFFISKVAQLAAWKRQLIFFSSALVSAAIFGLFSFKHKLLPLVDNTLIDSGLGPIGLYDAPTRTPRIFWVAVTAVAILAAVLLLELLLLALVESYKKPILETIRKNYLVVLVVSAICIYFLPIALLGVRSSGFYDRYLLFLLPLLMMVIAMATLDVKNASFKSRIFQISLALTLLYGSFTVAATHDYLLLNRTSWHASSQLIEKSQLSPQVINGGFEFNGWNLCNQSNMSPYEGDPWKRFDCLWGDDNDLYTIAFSKQDGYTVLEEHPLKRWLPFGPERILVLKRTALTTPSN